MGNNEIWVFLSHSNKDYEKVRQVRNMLENQSLRPLMFFLNCLNDEDEIDSLVKREIDSRTRFILCDSDNARKSRWVQMEVDYIKSQNRICETIDLSKSVEEIQASLHDFINKTKIFISYNREEYAMAKKVYDRLSHYDFSVYIDMYWDFNKDCHQKYEDALNFLHNSVVQSDGYVLSIMNENILNYQSGSRYELVKAIQDNKSIGKSIPNIIPFVSKDMMIDKIRNDCELHPLVECDIQSIEGFDIERQCDEIMKRVISQLMTPGSVKVLADNLRKETSQGANLEVEFLYKLLEQNSD